MKYSKELIKKVAEVYPVSEEHPECYTETQEYYKNQNKDQCQDM